MKCEICGAETNLQLSPDLDVEGLGTCEKDKEDMQTAYIILLSFGEKAYRDFIDTKRKALPPPTPK